MTRETIRTSVVIFRDHYEFLRRQPEGVSKSIRNILEDHIELLDTANPIMLAAFEHLYSSMWSAFKEGPDPVKRFYTALLDMGVNAKYHHVVNFLKSKENQ